MKSRSLALSMMYLMLVVGCENNPTQASDAGTDLSSDRTNDQLSDRGTDTANDSTSDVATDRQLDAVGDASQCNPTIESFGTSWTNFTTPGQFDAVRSVTRTASGYLLLVGTGYPRLVDIRTQIWTHENGTLTNTTPSVFTTFTGDVTYEQGHSLETLDNGTVFLSSRQVTSEIGILERGVLYTLNGSVATALTDVATFNTRSIGALTHRGNTLFGSGETRSAAPWLFSRTGDITTAIEFAVATPASINTMTSSADATWASSSADIFAVGATAIELAHPVILDVERAVFANGSLYAMGYRSVLEKHLYRYENGDWIAVCEPGSEIRNIRAFGNELFVVTDENSYLFNGTTWSRLPTGATGVYGTRDTLFGYDGGLNGQGRIMSLQP